MVLKFGKGRGFGHSNRKSQGGAVAPSGPLTTWNLADKNAGINLSNGNLTAAGTGSSQSARATPVIASGKYYFAATWDSGGTGMIGFGDSGMSLANYISSDGAGHAAAFALNGQVWSSGVQTGSFSAPAIGNAIGLAIDTANKLFWVSVNTAWLAGDPVAGTGGTSFSGIAGAVYPMMTSFGSTQVTLLTGNPGKPSGYTGLV